MDANDPTTNIVLLSASWLNVFLYAWELGLCLRYFKRPNRPFWYKIGVGALVVFDTLCTLTICLSVVFVNFLPNARDSVARITTTAVAIFLTYCSAAVEQAILCHVFFTLTGNIIITTILSLIILAHLGLAFASGVLILVLNAELTEALKITEAGAISCAIADVLIALALGSRVWKSLSPSYIISARHSFARRFFLLCISSGLIVASNTLVMMVLLLHGGPAFSFFFDWQGRVYSLTLLANFLVGIHFRGDNEITEVTVSSRSRPGQRTSRIAGITFDDIIGSDTESGRSQNVPSPPNADRKVTPLRQCADPQPYNYNLDDEWTQLERRRARTDP
ncbi:hypothetical protein R3P38DRAFT_3311080 [Favolaschia claudopus]|uniref:Transmembrane protein n=1 Tax=Favolaschia claudopus TaxID=2862362 RepID=A0AAW0CLY1_9AGAR